MNTYKVTTTTRREKVAVIKLIRAASGLGLKDSKDLAEDQIGFDSFMDDNVEILLRVDEAGLGRLCYHCVNNDTRAFITSAEVVRQDRVDFDFTTGGFSL